jgi:hypothetical protein
MIVQDYHIGKLDERSVTVGHRSRWHLWKVIIRDDRFQGSWFPVRSGDAGKARSGLTKNSSSMRIGTLRGSRSEKPVGKLVIKATILISAVVGSTASLFVVSWFGLALLGF